MPDNENTQEPVEEYRINKVVDFLDIPEEYIDEALEQFADGIREAIKRRKEAAQKMGVPLRFVDTTQFTMIYHPDGEDDVIFNEEVEHEQSPRFTPVIY